MMMQWLRVIFVSLVAAILLPQAVYAQINAASLARGQREAQGNGMYGAGIPGMDNTGMEGREGMEGEQTDTTETKKREKRALESYYFSDTVRALKNWKWTIDEDYNRVNIMPLDTVLADWRID